MPQGIVVNKYLFQTQPVRNKPSISLHCCFLLPYYPFAYPFSPLLLSHVHSDSCNNDPEILINFHLFQPPLNKKNWFLECCFIIYMYIWVASRIERFYPCLVNVSVCPVNAKILAPEIEAPLWEQKNGIAIFSTMALAILVKFQWFMETID